MGKAMPIVFVLIFFLCNTTTFSGDYYSNANKYLFIFPEYASLGGASLVYTSDATQLSNPANIPLQDKNQVSLAYSGFYENTLSTSVVSFTTNLKENIGLGLSSGYLYIPDILTTENFIVEENGKLIYNPHYASASEIFLNISLGYKLLERSNLVVTVGTSLHCLRRRLINWTGYGIGADLGASVIIPKANVRFSLLADDITSNYIRWSSSYHDNGLPHVRFGMGWRKHLPYIYGQISIMYKSPDLLANEGVGINVKQDLEPENKSIKKEPILLLKYANYGFEYLIHNIVSLRLGFDESRRTFFGGGINLFNQSLAFDFAYMVSYDLPGTYSLSTRYQW